MTRPRAASQTFVDNLPKELKARITPVFSPLITIDGLRYTATVTDDDAVIFTSANGVSHGPKGNGQPAYCVGAATTEAARENGWAAQTSGETADALVARLVQNPPSKKLIHLSGVHTRGNVSAQLKIHGLNAKNIAVYDQVAQSLSTYARELIASGNTVLVPLFSPRTSAQFAIQAPRATSLHVIALSYAVAQNLEAASYAQIIVASAPNARAMRHAIAATLSDLTAG